MTVAVEPAPAAATFDRLGRFEPSDLDPLLDCTDELSKVPGTKLDLVLAAIPVLVVESKSQRTLSGPSVLARVTNELNTDLLRHNASLSRKRALASEPHMGLPPQVLRLVSNTFPARDDRSPKGLKRIIRENEAVRNSGAVLKDSLANRTRAS
jgi:hypothetical protein